MRSLRDRAGLVAGTAVVTATILAAACSSGTTLPSATPSAAVPTTTSPTVGPATSAGEQPTIGPHDEPIAGSETLGDDYFPGLGNGGYDVVAYDLDLTIDPGSDRLDGVATIAAVATLPLASFNLDLVGLEVSAVTVDGVAAGFDHLGAELVITPVTPLESGEPFSVAVTYGGSPRKGRIDAYGIENGWFDRAGVIYVIGEPDASRYWYPCNDHPSDKATFTIRVSVPEPLTAAAPGRLVDSEHTGAAARFSYALDTPTSTYLATVVVGEFERIENGVENGVEFRDYLPASAATPPAAFTIAPEVIDAFDDYFGPFPYDTYGHIVVPGFPGALENPTLSIFGAEAVFETVVVHEIAHQWFGNSVSPATWGDIWLNEGFATFAEWLWIELSKGPESAEATIAAAHRMLAVTPHAVPGDPGPDELFGVGVYQRGALALHAVRIAVGDDAFFESTRAYSSRYRDSTASTNDVIALFEEISGQELSPLFDAWLFQAALPPLPG